MAGYKTQGSNHQDSQQKAYQPPAADTEIGPSHNNIVYVNVK